MTKSRSYHPLPKFLAFVLGFLSLVAIAIAADQAGKPMRETATVPSDSNVLKRFGAVDDYLTEKRWGEAIDVLQQILQADSRILVLAQSGAPGESARYVNVATHCNALLSRLPKEGLAVYRKMADPQARRWFEHWKQTRDPAELQRIVRHAFLSSLGDDALWALGEFAWDRGDFASARLYWTQLLPVSPQSTTVPTELRYPDSDFDVAEVQSRLVLCTLMEGEPERAAAEQERFANLFPMAEGTIAGRHGLLSDLLKQIIDEAAPSVAPHSVVDVSTFGITPDRSGTMSSAVDIGAVLWSRKLPSSRLYTENLGATPDPGAPSYFPVVHQDIVFVNDAERIWAWHVLTGEPAWPNQRGTAEVYVPEIQDALRTPVQASAGVPYFTMTIDDGRLYARMGSAITNRNLTETDDRFPSDLVCLDIATGEGKLVWKIASSELLKEDGGTWRFEGSPLVLSGRVYVALSRRRAKLEFCIVCMDAGTGQLLWNRPIGMTHTGVKEHHNRVSHLLLTSGAGKLFFSTDAGAIVAISQEDGRPEWAVTYESQGVEDISILSNHIVHGLVPAMFHEGWLFVAPNDCDRLFCIEADSGKVYRQWNQPAGDRWRHLLGVVSGGKAGRLIVSGNSIWALDINSKHVKDVFGQRSKNTFLGMDLSEPGYGRGVLAGKLIFWPTQQSIKIIDAETGKTINRKSLRTPQSAETGGNLVVASEMLLVAQHDRLVAYCEYSLLKQRLEKELSDRNSRSLSGDSAEQTVMSTNSRMLRLTTDQIARQLAEISVAAGKLDDAIKVLGSALESATQRENEASTARFRNRLLELLRRSAQDLLKEKKTDEAWDRLVEARKLVVSPSEVSSLLIEMGMVAELRGNAEAAVEVWQEILDNATVREVPHRSMTAGEIATEAIAKLISKHGAVIYRLGESRAREAIASRVRARDQAGLRQVLLQFPNSTCALPAWKYLAKAERELGHHQDSLSIHARLLMLSPDGNARALALAEWADELEVARYHQSAQRVWTQLASQKWMNETIDFHGESIRVGTLAQDRLKKSHPESPGSASTTLSTENSESSATYLDRVWSVLLSDDSHESMTEGGVPPSSNVLIPQFSSPADHLDCVLAHRADPKTDPGNTQWVCIDRRTGNIRWRQTFDSTPKWVAYGESNLLVATASHLFAMTLEEGRTLWQLPFPTNVESDQRPSPKEGSAAKATQRVASLKATQYQLAMRDNWVFAYAPRYGLTAIDARSGRIAWTFAPSRGILQPAWTCGLQKIALQTLYPPTVWLVDIAPERKASERPVPTESWLQGPNIDDDNFIIQLASDRHLDCRSKQTGRRSWLYEGAMSFAHADPVLWSKSGQLLLTVDGMTLKGIDRSQGQANWSTPLAHLPIDDPATQTVAAGDFVYAASHGLLKRISLKQGKCQWEQYLGSSIEQWRVADCTTSIVTWPIPARFQSQGTAAIRQFVVWCDAQTGQIVQRWNLSEGEHLINITGGNNECLVETNRAIVAFRAGQSTQ